MIKKMTPDRQNRYEGQTMDDGRQAVYDGVHATVVLVRMAYEAAIAEGFSPSEALSVGEAYLTSMLQNVAKTANDG